MKCLGLQVKVVAVKANSFRYLGLLPKYLKVTEGSIHLRGKNLSCTSEKELRFLRGKEIAYLFQNYQGSFTPFIKIGKQLIEAIKSHEKIQKEGAKRKVI